MNGSEPLVSVIIPAYNHEQFIQECIRSIIAQTYRKIELIVVDDGSSDKTFAKLTELKEECDNRFVHVIVERKEHEGTCHTLNRLISLAQGDYIYLIASDDVAKPYAIETEVIFLAQHHEYVLIVGDNEWINSESQRIGWNDKHEPTPLQTARYQTFSEVLHISSQQENFGTYSRLIRGNHIPNGYLINTNALRQIGMFSPEAPLEDWYMMLQLSKIGKFKYIDLVLFSYRWHDHNTAKRKEHMAEVTGKTYFFEKELVHQPGNEQWARIFESTCIRKYISFPPLITFYKEKGGFGKRMTLRIFGHEFIF